MAYILKTTGEMVQLPNFGKLSDEERLNVVRHAVGGPFTVLILPGNEEVMLLPEMALAQSLSVNHPATAVAYQVLNSGDFIKGDVVVGSQSELDGSGALDDPDRDVLEILPEPITFYPPFYLVKAVVTCRKCGKDYIAAAVLATAAVCGEDNMGASYFCNTPELPAKLLLEIQWNVPNYRKDAADSGTMECFVNTCPDCGAVTDDRTLFHSDGPFAAHNQNRASMSLLLYENPVTVRASLEQREGEL